MYAQRITVPLLTAADGTCTALTPQIDYGQISQIRYLKDGTNPFANGVAFAVTLLATGEQVWAESGVNASATRAPRQPTHGIDGTPSVFAAGGAPVQDKIAVVGDKVQIAVSAGGNAKNGVIEIILV